MQLAPQIPMDLHMPLAPHMPLDLHMPLALHMPLGPHMGRTSPPAAGPHRPAGRGGIGAGCIVAERGIGGAAHASAGRRRWSSRWRCPSS